MCQPNDSLIQFLDIDPREMKTLVQTKTCSQMFIVRAQTENNSNIHQQVNINKLWYTHTMELNNEKEQIVDAGKGKRSSE